MKLCIFIQKLKCERVDRDMLIFMALEKNYYNTIVS